MTDWSRRERHRKRSCQGKVRYGDEPLARAGAADMLRRSGEKRASAYPCEFCGLWHVASDGPPGGRWTVTLPGRDSGY